jgi:hypothetical protein
MKKEFIEIIIGKIKKMNITDLCFKLITIKDNREYHYANYGDFIVIMIKSNDYMNGYINATKLYQLLF